MVNKVILVGALGGDPEVKATNGKTVARFSLATNESYTDQSGEKKKITDWHKIVVWGKLAEICGKHLSKGSKAYIEGKLKTRSWEDNGQKKYVTEVVAHTVQFVGDNKSQESHPPYEDESQEYF